MRRCNDSARYRRMRIALRKSDRYPLQLIRLTPHWSHQSQELNHFFDLFVQHKLATTFAFKIRS